MNHLFIDTPILSLPWILRGSMHTSESLLPARWLGWSAEQGLSSGLRGSDMTGEHSCRDSSVSRKTPHSRPCFSHCLSTIMAQLFEHDGANLLPVLEQYFPYSLAVYGAIISNIGRAGQTGEPKVNPYSTLSPGVSATRPESEPFVVIIRCLRHSAPNSVSSHPTNLSRPLRLMASPAPSDR